MHVVLSLSLILKVIYFCKFDKQGLFNDVSYAVEICEQTMISAKITMMYRFMLCQRITWFGCFSTMITWDGDPSDMIWFYVLLYISPTTLLSTHLAYSCLFFNFCVRIGIIAEYNQWLHLFVQTVNVCVVSCAICECNCCFKCGLNNSTFNSFVLVCGTFRFLLALTGALYVMMEVSRKWWWKWWWTSRY